MSPRPVATQVPPNRKPANVATTSVAQGKSTQTLLGSKRVAPKLPKNLAQSFENIEHTSCVFVAQDQRERIIDKLIRMIEAKDRKNPNRPKYDPRAIWRLTSQHLGVPEQTIVYVAQHYILESLKWRRFVRVDLPLVMTRADEAANAAWRKRSA